MKKIGVCISVLILPVVAFSATRSQSAIQNGTNVRARVTATGLYSQECYDEYYGCMDQFCISDNINGGSCACSNDNEKYESELAEINQILTEAERIRTVEVEKIKLGSNVDIVFGGGRTYDDKGNVVYNTNNMPKQNKAEKRDDLLKLFDVSFDTEEDDDDSIFNKTGVALFNAAHETCVAQISDKCSRDIKFLQQTYARQIESDCRAFANSIAVQRTAAQTAMNNAESDVRTALKESFDSANKYNQGECMVELKKCMTGADACGSDWENCVWTVASENMQNNRATSTANTTLARTVKYNISESVLERLESKRNICERVLDQCMAVRDTVWTAFLREIAPTLKLAELRAESNLRTSCLNEITQCIHTACRDDIAGKGTATMDSCLSRPDMARSFCKIQIDPCERMEPQIWSYVTDKLLAMRVDACTNEVKSCFTDESRCGPDFMNCIGMDYAFIHEMCPVDSLVTCKAYNKDQGKEFTMDDIDKIVMGLYLNIDNRALENCQKLVEDKMTEICGSTTDCNRFATDDTIGTGSLQYQKNGAVHRVTGMMSFGQIKVGSGEKDENYDNNAGMIDVVDYVNYLTTGGYVPEQYEYVADAIIQELYNIQGTINRVVTMIEKDPQIQFCVTGRDLDQITGERKTTVARFPHLLDQAKMQIAIAALRQAQDNYNKKYNEYIAKASQAQSLDMANLMCNKLPAADGTAQGISASDLNVNLLPPGAIVVEFGGVSNASLAAGGTHSTRSLGKTTTETKAGAAAGGSDGGALSTIASTAAAVNITKPTGIFKTLGGQTALSFNPAMMIADSALKAVVALASDHYTTEFDGGTREMWSTFNRDTRVCHVCTSTVTRDCKNKGSRGFLGLWDSRGVDCVTNDPIEKCEDIEM
jgi:hypothetical protein